MIYSREMFSLLAKRLALFANENVPILVGKNGPDVTSVVLTLMPIMVERAIITNNKLPSEVAILVAAKFMVAYEDITRMKCNSGGFSNVSVSPRPSSQGR